MLFLQSGIGANNIDNFKEELDKELLSPLNEKSTSDVDDDDDDDDDDDMSIGDDQEWECLVPGENCESIEGDDDSDDDDNVDGGNDDEMGNSKESKNNIRFVLSSYYMGNLYKQNVRFRIVHVIYRILLFSKLNYFPPFN